MMGCVVGADANASQRSSSSLTVWGGGETVVLTLATGIAESRLVEDVTSPLGGGLNSGGATNGLTGSGLPTEHRGVQFEIVIQPIIVSMWSDFAEKR